MKYQEGVPVIGATVTKTLWCAAGDVEKDFWLAFDLLRSHKDHEEFTVVRDWVRQVRTSPLTRRFFSWCFVLAEARATGYASACFLVACGSPVCGRKIWCLHRE